MNIRRKKAFSLMELSLVILVIGLLIVGMTKAGIIYDKQILSSARSLTKSSPVNVIEGLSLWLDTTSKESFDKEKPKDLSEIKNWHDINKQRIGKITFTQDTSSARPVFTKRAINRLPALKFTSSDSQFLASENSVSAHDLFGSNEITVFLVQNHIATNSTSISWSVSDGASGHYRFNIHAVHGSSLYFDFGLCCGSSVRKSEAITDFSTKNKVLSFRKDPEGNYEARIDGVLTSSSTSLTGSIPIDEESKIYIGAGGGFITSGDFLDGYMGEIIVFDHAISDSQRLEVEEYLSKKWRIKF